MKILEATTLTNIIEDHFGEVDLDLIRIPSDLKRYLGVLTINTDHDKVESWYDRTHEWLVPWSRMEEDD